MTMVENFIDAFRRAFQEARHRLAAEWDTTWSTQTNWNHLMIQTTADLNPRPPTVVEHTAKLMDIKCWPGEPFSLDAVFVPKECRREGPYPYPILVALEHENEVSGFDNEITKLHYIRCPLKVGITYALMGKNNALPRTSEYQTQIGATAARVAAELARYTRETPETKYLFLVGSEESPRTLTWHALEYGASDSPRSANWKSLI